MADLSNAQLVKLGHRIAEAQQAASAKAYRATRAAQAMSFAARAKTLSYAPIASLAILALVTLVLMNRCNDMGPSSRVKTGIGMAAGALLAVMGIDWFIHNCDF